MQCPKCGYEPTMAEMQSSPDRCPSCEVYYAKVSPPVAAPPAAVEAKKVTLTDWANANPRAKWILALVGGLVIGYFVGREHVKYEIRSAISESVAGIGGLFGGRESRPPAPAERPKPAAKKESPITAKLVDKGYLPGEYGRDAITLDLIFQNSTGKDVRAFGGVVSITDLLDNKIMDIHVSVSDPVARGAALAWSGSIDFNQFKSDHKALKAAEQQNILVTFSLNKVLYSDGSVSEM